MKSQEELYKEALEEKEAILKELEPLRAEEEIAIKKSQKAKEELKAIRDRIVSIEVERKLADVSMIISKLAPNQKKLSGIR